VRPLLRGLLGFALFVAGLVAGGAAVFWWLSSSGPPRVWEATVLVPLVDNRGERVPPERWNNALEPLVDDFGGATLGPEQEGWWRDSQKQIHREPVRPVVVSFDHQRLAEFRRAVLEVGRRLGQEAIYVRLEEPRVEVLSVGEGNSQKDR
jgi:hypothetical protein